MTLPRVAQRDRARSSVGAASSSNGDTFGSGITLHVSEKNAVEPPIVISNETSKKRLRHEANAPMGETPPGMIGSQRRPLG